MERGSLSFPAAVILGLLVGAGAALAGYFVGQGFFQGRRAERYVSVKGLAERDVKADLALWTLKFSATGSDISAVSTASEHDSELVRAFIIKSGFIDREVEALPTRIDDQFAFTALVGPPNVEAARRYVVTAGFEIRTSRVDAVRAASQLTGELIRQGVVLDGHPSVSGGVNPAYLFTRVSDIRPAMLAQATRSARALAQQFAADSNSRLGPIRRASEGVFEVLSRDGERANPAEERASIEKRLRLVSTVEYYLVE
ncbi:MAG TPA: SIMPL domain-containing protein [Candidatus Binataceae bacterium]|nr:SIMPL domain-containing protein [Candidatus Binataceae bacterium]